MTLRILDTVIRQVQNEVAAHEPERGGALLGPRGRDVVSLFVPDPAARVTAVSYIPSRRLISTVTEFEREAGLEFKGILHSHPSSLDRPSGQDNAEVAKGLGLNPHLALYLCPIVTHREVARGTDHETAVAGGKISWHAARRTRSNGVRVQRMPVTVIPLDADAERVAHRYGASTPVPAVELNVEGVDLVGRRIVLPGLEVLVLFSESHPAVAPVVLATPEGGSTRQLHLEWSLAVPAEERLLRAMEAHLEGDGPFVQAFGPAGRPAIMRDPVRAALAG